MDWSLFIRVFGCVLIVLYLVTGIDDAIWFLSAMLSALRNRGNEKKDELDFDELRKTPPKMLAVTIAAWHEANVIGDVITNFLNTTDYPESMFHLFVGVYPNDPDTIAAVEAAGRIYPNVHAVINCKEGPTTKAQNINHVIRQIRVFEQDHHLRFASLTVHDSEDVIHPYELLATNYLINEHDALQFPVFPIMELPRFSNFFKQLTTATYADEFAENHYFTMVQRENLHAFVPCAGTGFAISRKIIEEFGDRDVLPSESLTEDYLLSLQLYKRGIPLHYVLNKLPRVMKDGKIRTDYIATRSLFPNTFKAAVRQRTRWTYGITMQSISFRDVLSSKGVSLAGRYSFYRDFKAKYLNLVPIFGYFAAVYCLVSLFFDLEPLYSRDTPVYYMAEAVFVIMIIRQIFRGVALYRVYGFRSVFFGCLLPPLFPIRMIYGNIISFTATVRAFLMKLFGDRPKGKKENSEHRKKAKKPVKWAKTDHVFLSQRQLRRYRRMLGDALITQGCLSAKTFQDALAHVDKQHGEQIGTYLIKKGLVTEEQVIRALSHIKHTLFVPEPVVRKLDYERTLANYDREKLARMKLLPLTVEKDICIVGICNETRDADLYYFESKYGLKTRRMYLMESAVEEALRSEPSHAGDESSQPLDSLSLYHAGLIQYEQVVLIGIYSLLLGKAEAETRRYMGILAQQPGRQQATSFCG